VETITSRNNAAVKEIRGLKKRAARDSLGLAFVEGRRLVDDALSAHGLGSPARFPVRTICFSESFVKGAGAGDSRNAALIARASVYGDIRLIEMPDQTFASVSDTLNPQGVLAVVSLFSYTLNDIMNGGDRILILDRVADPGNVGVMLRTAEAADFSGVILSDGCADVYEPKVLRAAMGAAFRIPFVRDANLEEAVADIRLAGFRVYASAPASVDARTEAYDCFSGAYGDGDSALVVGSEAAGVDPGIIALCDGVISIPMPGGAESLNAGVAAGILMYELMRRQKMKGNV